MKNQCNLIGRLSRDPYLAGTEENPVCFMTLAVNRNYRNQQGEREADFIPIKAFKEKKLATTCHNNLQKGSLIAVTARLQAKFKDNKTEIEIIAEDIVFLDSGKRRLKTDDDGENNHKYSYEENYHQEDIIMPWER
ncbi:single-stranded DNA-binding protein [Niallia sp. MER TA 168]|uniref:single-stranded DNA-binding protein n=1 Tax=Niallia sp. MER TA 168 TaxID=2939568 RepID=UPI00203A418A|nr:single-stranded DNA-binding protein [Niallia sp. MER TA 168]MCM3362006.1 single-stranded DNA-binding protein [Niallia sp. MER TA 168]